MNLDPMCTPKTPPAAAPLVMAQVAGMDLATTAGKQFLREGVNGQQQQQQSLLPHPLDTLPFDPQKNGIHAHPDDRHGGTSAMLLSSGMEWKGRQREMWRQQSKLKDTLDAQTKKRTTPCR